MARPPKLDWYRLREEWINQNLVERESAYTLKMMADDHEISYSYLQNIAAKQSWNQLLKDRKAEAEDKAIEYFERSNVFNEIETRVRQATYGQIAQRKAAIFIGDLDPAKLTTKEAIDLMRLGADLERKALGLPDTFVFSSSTSADEEFTNEKAKEVLQEAITLIEQEDGSFALNGNGSGKDSELNTEESPTGKP